MIVINNEKVYRPKTLSITFETEKEFWQFKEVIRHCDTVPDAIVRDGGKIDRDFVCNFMHRIFNAM